MADAGGTAPGGSERSRDVVLLDRTNRLRLQLTGPKAAESLTGLVTSDVLALTPGQGQYSAALTPRGKVLADLRIFARSDDLLIDTGAASGPGLLAMIRKYVNPRLARHEDVSASLGDLGVFGPDAPALLRTVLGDVHPAELADYSHVETRYSDAALMVARVPDYGVDGFDLIAPAPALETLRRDLEAAGARSVTGDESLEAARIEAGRPVWGIDMDDTMLAQEVDLDRLGAISFTKGCYTGQETVARVHYRGHVNRHLRGLRFSSLLRPPPGTELRDAAAGKPVGTVLSAAVSPSRGLVALGLIRREIEPGALVYAAWAGGANEAVVAALPFVT